MCTLGRNQKGHQILKMINILRTRHIKSHTSLLLCRVKKKKKGFSGEAASSFGQIGLAATLEVGREGEREQRRCWGMEEGTEGHNLVVA